MKLSVRKEPMLEIGTVGEKTSYSSTVWVLCLATLMVLGNVLAFVKMWGTLSPGIVKVAAVAFLTMILTAVIEFFKRKYSYIGIAKLVPWVLFFSVAGRENIYTGMKIWQNLLLSLIQI